MDRKVQERDDGLDRYNCFQETERSHSFFS